MRKYRNYKKLKTKKNTKRNKLTQEDFSYSINYFFIFIRILFLLIIFYIAKFSFKTIRAYKNNNKRIFEKIIDFEKNLKNITENEIQEFRQFNIDNKLLNEQNFKKGNNPDISVIITIHNQAHCLHKCLRSVQNQSIKNLEIIFVDDCSTDNSTEIIKEFQKYDERIILINHDTNEGTIKSRTDGVRQAKGKYISIIDGDDTLIHKDVFYNSLYIANLGNLDVVEFKASYYRNRKFKEVVNSYSLINLTDIVYQPELRTKFFIITDNNDGIRAVQNRNIWGKLIRNKVFQQAIINIGPKYTDDYILQYEDTIMAVALFQVAQSYYLMKEIGYYYSRDEFGGRFPAVKGRTCKPNTNKIKDMGHIKLLQFLLEKTENNELERQLVYHELISIDHYLSLVYFTYHNYEIVYEVIDPLIQSPFLKEKQKERLTIIKNKLLEKQNKKLI